MVSRFDADVPTPIGVAEPEVSVRSQLLGVHRRFRAVRWIMLGLVAVLAALLYYETGHLRKSGQPATLAAFNALNGVDRACSAFRGWLMTGEPVFAEQQAVAWRSQVAPSLDRLGRALPEQVNLPVLKQRLGQLRETQEAALAAGVPPADADRLVQEELEPLLQEVRATLSAIAHTQAAGLEEGTTLVSGIALGAAAFLLLAMVLMLVFARRLAAVTEESVLGPVRVLTTGTMDLAAGRLREDLPVRSNDELGRLARAINKLRVSLALAEMKYRSLFSHTSNSMLLVNPDDLTITDANHSFEILTSMKRRDLVGKSVVTLFDEEQRDALREGMRMPGGKRQHTISGITMTTPTRLMVVLGVRISMIQALSETVMEMSFLDVTEQYIQNQALSEIAFKDELTGLFNHRSFYQRLQEAIYQARTHSQPLVLLFVDLDNFKQCNDTYGHQVGDQLLRNVGEIILRHIRQDRDAGFRYGGDEFAVLLYDAPVHVGERLANQVRESFEQVEKYGTSMSIGVAQLRNDLEAESLVKAADDALYAAKSAGKNTVRVSQ